MIQAPRNQISATISRVESSGMVGLPANLACGVSLAKLSPRDRACKGGRWPLGQGSANIGHTETTMPQTITVSAKALCEAAEREVETLSIEDALKLHGRDDTVLI